MKLNSIFRLVLFGFICAFLASSCVKEGPIGPAGLDGEDGVDGQDGQDGQITCLGCHSGNSMEAIQAQFAYSVHSAGAIAVDYAGGRASCAPCHSHELFVQVQTVGEVYGDITNPTAWKCSTCHGIHNTFEEGYTSSLRVTDPPVALWNEATTLDLIGNSNLCATCHQSRRPEPNLDKPGDTYTITSTHYGPHHGPQANVVLGVGFAEIEGSADYPDPGSSYHHVENGSCVGCHMGSFDEFEMVIDGETEDVAGGGHSWIPNLTACEDCHNTDMDDYNYHGRRSTVEDQLEEIRDMLVQLGVVEYAEEGEWVWDPEEGEHVEENIEGGYHPVRGTYPMIQVQAFFNWIGLEEDRSLGVHNPPYVNALLVNTKEALEAEIAKL